MKGVCGLGNVGNTCYINAALQILSQIDELNDYLFTTKRLKGISDSDFVIEWIGLVKMIRETQDSILPYRFIEKLRHFSMEKKRSEFSTNRQADSVEFFEFMIETIHNSLNLLDSTLPKTKSGCIQVDQYIDKNEKMDSSVVSKMFLSCILNQYIHPETKKIEFYKLEHSYKMELSIPEKSNVSIYDCLIDTFKEESLHGEDAWFDEKENKKKDVLKRCAFAHCPLFLCLHLKRWKEDGTKKKTLVHSPELLDMTRFTIYKEKQQYRLFGIINHEGGNRGGHYYSYILREGQWFSLNDQLIQPILPESIVDKSNYCLFYKKIK